MAGEIILILGGARSGKSLFAQRLAAELGERVLFVAPMEAGDSEMRLRIERHKRNRPGTWRTLEVATGIAAAVGEHIGDADVVLLDCLTLLVSNLMSDANSPEELDTLESEIAGELEKLLERRSTSFIIVSNEVGMGLVPPYPMGRACRDLLGRANQLAAERADRVYLMIAGIPMEVKGQATKDVG